MTEKLNQTFEEFNTLYPKVVGRNIRRYLAAYDLSQTELAKRLGVSQQTVSYWCNGLKTPRQQNIDDMCAIFHCNRSDLMQEYNIGGLEAVRINNDSPLTVTYRALDKRKLDIADILAEIQKMNDSNLEALLSYARFLNLTKKEDES